MRTRERGVRLLSELTIDADKDFQSKSLTNISALESIAYRIGANKLQILQATANLIMARNSGNTGYIGLQVSSLYPHEDVVFMLDAKTLSAPNLDNAFTYIKARDNGVGILEVARIRGAAEPSFDLKYGRLTGDFNANGKKIVSQRYTYGDTLIGSSDAEITEVSAVLVKKKELTLTGYGDLRIKFDIKETIAHRNVQARIYKNGVAVGTLRVTGSDTYVTFSEDIAGFNSGDTIELWAGSDDTGTCYVCNFRVYVGLDLPRAV